jgi:CDP-diacylglycerol--glycerol-3-phosphate 3-phosphatidyltransferase
MKVAKKGGLMPSANGLQEWFGGLPNKLTLARIASIPVLLLLYPWDYLGLRVIAALVFLVAAFTDFLDGYLARRYQLETTTGALLDPIADKLLVLTGVVLLVSTNALWSWIAVLILGREFAVSGLRMIALEKRFMIEVNQMGKVKTSCQIVGIFCLMINKPLFEFPFREFGMVAIWASVALSYYSAYLYWQEFLKNLKNERLSF